MILAVDVGNTRIKWGLRDGDRWVASGAVASADTSSLTAAWATLAPEKAAVSNVAGRDVQALLEQALSPICRDVLWATAQGEQCGVKNGYRVPGQLGSDRWAALIGARSLSQSPCLVVNAGTALTADALDGEGRFLGGIIVPGLRLMGQVLANNTAALDVSAGTFAPFPDNTADAICSGALLALAGTAERMLSQLSQKTESVPHCIVSGGDAPTLLPLLPAGTRHVENLVLEGLIRMVRP